MIEMAAAAFFAGLLVFEIIKIIITVLSSDKTEISERISALSSDRSETQPKEKKIKKRVRRKKRTGTAAARTRKQLEKLGNEIYDAGIKMPVQRFFTLWLVLAVGVPGLLYAMKVNSIICLVAAGILAAGPIVYIRTKKKKRRNELEAQLVEAISILCNALRAGHSFQAAMNSIAEEMTGAVSEEFGRVFKETQHGMTLEDSFNRMVERTGSGDLEMLCTAILIQREVGGNLAEVLENISGTIQARLGLKAEIKTKTASGRLSGYMVGALPLLILLAISAINPGYTGPLFTTKAGNIMLGISVVMEIVGFIAIQKTVTIKY